MKSTVNDCLYRQIYGLIRPHQVTSHQSIEAGHPLLDVLVRENVNQSEQ